MNLIQNQQKMLDILFANKNKLYGAYALRSAYGQTVFRSLGVLCITLALVFGAIYYFKDNNYTRPDSGQVLEQDSVIIVPFKLFEEKQEQANLNASKQTKNSSISSDSFNPTRVNENALDTAAHQDNQNLTAVNTTSGTSANGDSFIENNVHSNGTANGTETTPLDLFAVDENPEFDGGINALLGFVRKHVKYPAMAAEYQKQGTLYVKFVVDESGNVSQIELLNQLGYGLDDEAKRVVSMIPKFKSPGKVKGKAVKTYYQLPIKFKLG